MARCKSSLLTLAICCALSSVAAIPLEANDYLTKIKPVLRERCYACHGALKQEAGLRLDTVALMTKGGDGGAAVKAGDVASLLVAKITADEAPTRKWRRFGARGRFKPLLRRSSHITVILRERGA